MNTMTGKRPPKNKYLDLFSCSEEAHDLWPFIDAVPQMVEAAHRFEPRKPWCLRCVKYRPAEQHCATDTQYDAAQNMPVAPDPVVGWRHNEFVGGLDEKAQENLEHNFDNLDNLDGGVQQGLSERPQQVSEGKVQQLQRRHADIDSQPHCRAEYPCRAHAYIRASAYAKKNHRQRPGCLTGRQARQT